MRYGETPVPIPNTTVKPMAADGTALETVWESRWLPDFYNLIAQWQSAFKETMVRFHLGFLVFFIAGFFQRFLWKRRSKGNRLYLENCIREKSFIFNV